MKKFFFLLVFILNAVFSLAQKEDRNWVFGDSIGINFNNLSNPTLFSTHSLNNEACATISDKNGNRIFYTSEQNGGPYYGVIYNKQDEILENSDSINFFYSSTNGALFLPFPGDSNHYYFFSLRFDIFLDSNQILYYSIIDKSLNFGNGKVVSKNNELDDSLLEKICAIKHGNGRDWWLILHKQHSSIFVKYLIGINGIEGPFYQNIGSFFFTLFGGEIAASKDGSKIASVSGLGNFDLFDFDRCSGELSNWKELGQPPYDGSNVTYFLNYGVEFSSDGSKLYLGQVNETFQPGSKIIQYSIESDTILSNTVLDSTSGITFYQFQLAPDNKIYIAGSPNPNTLDSSYKYLSVINNPNDSGLACNLDLFSFYLGGNNSMLGLPNMPNYNLGALDESPCDTLNIGIKEIHSQSFLLNIYPNPSYQELTIEILNGVKPKSITVTDATGKEVMKINSTKPKTQANIATLGSGLYFVKVIEMDGSVTVKKFVKQ